MLINTSGYFEEQVTIKMQTITALIEPSLIIFIAALIFTIMLTIFFPLLRVMDLH